MNGMPLHRFSRWRDQLTASDPGLARLRFAARITLAVGLTLLVLVLLASATGQSFFNFFVGVSLAMIASSAVNDKTPAAQRLTMLLIPLPAALAVVLGGRLSFSATIGEMVFVLVMFVAVYVRRYGPRWFAFGMVGFLSYFFALFVRAQPAQLPWMILSLVIAAACAYLMRFWVLPERSPASVKAILPAVRAQTRLILDDLAAAIRQPDSIGRFRQIRRGVVQLNEILLIPDDTRMSSAPQRALFEAELAVQRLVAIVPRGHSSASAPAMLHDLASLRAALEKPAAVPGPALDWQTPASDPLGAVLRDLANALADPALRQATPPSAPPEKPTVPQEPEVEGAPIQAPETPAGLRPTTRQAIQVATASILAILGGELLSPVRWYWAVITAFIVFTGTSTRGDVFVKSWRRVAGTLLGVITGVLVAKLVDGRVPLALTLIFLCIFLGFYLLRLSYTLMIFWITILLALLYELLGSFSVGLLALRLEETALGASIGILVAILVLPTKTQPLVLEASRDFLLTLSSVVGTCRLEHNHDQAGQQSLAGVRELDQSFQKLRQQTAPLNFRLPGTSIRNSQRWLRVLLTLLYEAHNLVRLSHETTQATLDRATLDAMKRLQERIEHLARAIGSGRASPVSNRTSETTTERIQRIPYFEQAALGPERHLPPFTRCLLRIEWIIAVLTNELGVDEETGRDTRPAGTGESLLGGKG